MPTKHSVTDEQLASLFLYWYGTHPVIRRCLAEESASCQELPDTDLEHVWRTKWFAKGDLTARVDQELSQRYGSLFLGSSSSTTEFPKDNVFSPPSSSSSSSVPLWKRMAYIVLLDQVSRNVHRWTPKAYAYDTMALEWALPLVEAADKSILELPFCFQATVCICLCHSETLEIQALLQQCLKKMKSRVVRGRHGAILEALQVIADKHAERVHVFGHFPERNACLGRNSTIQEEIFLQQLGS